MKTYPYYFTEHELVLLRDAMADLKHNLQPAPGCSKERATNYRVAAALHEQFKADLLKIKD